jgi:cardiolipin synthase C
LLGGGGKSTEALAALVQHAQHSIVIQSPYLVMSDAAKKLFKQAIKRGVTLKSIPIR